MEIVCFWHFADIDAGAEYVPSWVKADIPPFEPFLFMRAGFPLNRWPVAL
jgi:hypothetical protein